MVLKHTLAGLAPPIRLEVTLFPAYFFTTNSPVMYSASSSIQTGLHRYYPLLLKTHGMWGPSTRYYPRLLKTHGMWGSSSRYYPLLLKTHGMWGPSTRYYPLLLETYGMWRPPSRYYTRPTQVSAVKVVLLMLWHTNVLVLNCGL